MTIIATILLAATVAATSAPPPDFQFHDFAGGRHTLAEFRGHPVLLDFWASWCSPCRESFPYLDGLQARHVGNGLKVVAVSLDEDGAAARDFVDAVPVHFFVGRDPEGHGGELFDVAVMPTALLLDADGRVVARFEGGGLPVHRQIEDAVIALVRGAPLPDGATTVARKGPSGNLRAWERGYLADPIMSLDGDPLGRLLSEHIHSSKEAAAGDGGVAGGGCGCN